MAAHATRLAKTHRWLAACTWFHPNMFALFFEQVIVVKRQRFSVTHLSSKGSIARGVNHRKDSKLSPMDSNELVLREIPDKVVVLTPDERIAHWTRWTRGAEKILDHDSLEAEGQLPQELPVPQEQQAEETRYLAQLKQAGSCSCESVRRTKSGALIHVDMPGKAIRAQDGALAHLLMCRQDVTRLKATRDAKLLEAKFRDLLECMPNGSVMLNATGHIAPANTLAKRLFGHAHHELQDLPDLPADCLRRDRQSRQQVRTSHLPQ